MVAGAGASSEGSMGPGDLLGSVTWLLSFITRFLVGVSGRHPFLSPLPDVGLSTGPLTAWHLVFISVRGQGTSTQETGKSFCNLISEVASPRHLLYGTH